MSARVSTATAIVVLGLSVVGVGLSTWAGGGDAFALAGLPFAVVGALLLLRGAGHRIGWVLCGIGLLTCTGPASAMIAAMQVADGRPPDGATLAPGLVQRVVLGAVPPPDVGGPAGVAADR